MRKKIVAGNWKMNNGSPADAVALAQGVVELAGTVDAVDVVLCPPFTSIAAVADAIQGSKVGLGAQNIYPKDSGAFTGEVSGTFLKALGCQYVIIGHSERREYFGETDESVNLKIKAAFKYDLTPIVCVGESLELYQAGKTETWVTTQVEAALEGLTAGQVTRMILAYEPIWAIGTGLAATAEEAERVCGQVVRAKIAKLYDQSTAEAVRIQYGGSVKPANAQELMSQPNIDGALVGGASLKAEDFCEIVRLSAKVKGLT